MFKFFYICLFWCCFARGADVNSIGGQTNAQEVQKYMQQQLQIDQDRLLQDPAPWVGGQELDESNDSVEEGDTASCIKVKHININGAHILNLREMVSGFEGRCLGAVGLEKILSLITGAYVSRGYITSRAYLPEQNLSDGTLLIEVSEGLIEDFKLEGLPEDHKNINLNTAFPYLKNRVLNLRDIEQGIDQINYLQSNQSSIQIFPGTSIGKSIVSISNKSRSKWRSSLTYDNTGQKATGRDQYGINASIDSPFGLGDGLRAAYQTSNPKFNNVGYSNLGSINYFLPFGYSTFSFGYLTTAYQYLQTLASGSNYFSNGYASNTFAQYSYVAYRNSATKLNISSTFTHKESKNFFAGYFLSINSPSLSVVDADISLSRILRGWGSTNLGIGLSQGLNIAGATNNLESPGSPQAQFNKYRQFISINISADLNPFHFIWSGHNSAQQTNDVLYGSEQFSILGPYAVRGFSNNYLSGNSGFYSRNDFSLQRNFNFEGHSTFLKMYSGLDFGSTFIPGDRNFCSALVSSATAGLALTFRGYSIDLSFSKPLRTLGWMLPEYGLAYLRLKYDINSI